MGGARGRKIGTTENSTGSNLISMGLLMEVPRKIGNNN
jgi:hypothetical protein